VVHISESSSVEEIRKDYYEKFPELFDHIIMSANSKRDVAKICRAVANYIAEEVSKRKGVRILFDIHREKIRDEFGRHTYTFADFFVEDEDGLPIPVVSMVLAVDGVIAGSKGELNRKIEKMISELEEETTRVLEILRNMHTTQKVGTEAMSLIKEVAKIVREKHLDDIEEFYRRGWSKHDCHEISREVAGALRKLGIPAKVVSVSALLPEDVKHYAVQISLRGNSYIVDSVPELTGLIPRNEMLDEPLILTPAEYESFFAKYLETAEADYTESI